MQLSRKLELLARVKPEYDNLRLVAISNIRFNNEKSLRAWWHRKYKIPPKPIEDYTFEELLIENFEDFYSNHPEKAVEFLKLQPVEVVEVEDMTVPSHVQWILDKRKGRGKIEKYKTAGDENLTDEECQNILSGIRGTRQGATSNPSLPQEFDDDFT